MNLKRWKERAQVQKPQMVPLTAHLRTWNWGGQVRAGAEQTSDHLNRHYFVPERRLWAEQTSTHLNRHYSVPERRLRAEQTSTHLNRHYSVPEKRLWQTQCTSINQSLTNILSRANRSRVCLWASWMYETTHTHTHTHICIRYGHN